MSKSRTHKKEKVIKPYNRKIHFDNNEVWTYEIKSSHIHIKDPDGNKHNIGFDVFTGWSWDALERASSKGCIVPQIKPSDVKEWIKAHKKGKKFFYHSYKPYNKENDYRHGDVWICSVTKQAVLFREAYTNLLEYTWSNNDEWFKATKKSLIIRKFKNYKLIYRERKESFDGQAFGEPRYDKCEWEKYKESKKV